MPYFSYYALLNEGYFMNFKFILSFAMAATLVGCYGDKKSSTAIYNVDISNNEEPAVAYGDAEARVVKSRNEIATLLLKQTSSSLISDCSQVRLQDCEKYPLESGIQLGRAYYLLVNRANNAAKLAPDIISYQNYVEISNQARKEVIAIQRDLKASRDSQDIIGYSLESYIVKSCFAKDFNKGKPKPMYATYSDDKQMTLSQDECVKSYENSYSGLDSLNSEYFDGLSAIFHIYQKGNSIDLIQTPLSYLNGRNLITYKKILAELGNSYSQARSNLNVEKLLDQKITRFSNTTGYRLMELSSCSYRCFDLSFDSGKTLVKWEKQLDQELGKIKYEVDRLAIEKKKFAEVTMTIQITDAGIRYSLNVAKVNNSDRLYYSGFEDLLKALKTL